MFLPFTALGDLWFIAYDPIVTLCSCRDNVRDVLDRLLDPAAGVKAEDIINPKPVIIFHLAAYRFIALYCQSE